MAKAIVAAVLLCVIAAIAPLARAVTIEGTPVHINSCYLLYRDPTNRRYTDTIIGPLYITFENQTTKEIDAVHFSVVLHDREIVIHDVGTFSAGATIAHQFGDLNSYQWPYEAKTQPRCTVTYVKFGDGTIWRTSG